ncbi:MAG: trehalose-6-phosphate synthase [Actinobacteria bacterium]|nr:trehalose-6-phosphate synthase [Actinomycetota bacterium]
MSDRPIVVVSNRGPVSFGRSPSGDLEARRGAGGLVSGIAPLLQRPDRMWIAAAMSDDDRAAAVDGSVQIDGLRAHLLPVDPADVAGYYDIVCNSTLWYVHHHLFDLAHTPVFDPAWFDAWHAYARVNTLFADAIARLAPTDAVVLVQDYHLYLVGSLLTTRRPDLAAVHFSHTPFASPEMFAVLPDEVATTILAGLAAHRACGFHTPRWRDDFLACCARSGVTAPDTFVSPLGPDRADLEAATRASGYPAAAARLDSAVGERRCIARSDRIELSKNIVRGFLAFDTLLEQWPEWRGRVVFAASVYPSRTANPDYVAYGEQVAASVRAINERWGTPDWTPILLDTSDDFTASIATLARADVVLVNPIRDGLNLVASEAMVVNDRDALLALSPEAGAWAVLGGSAAAVQPFDVAQTAAVLHELLSTPPAERSETARRLRMAATTRSPASWLADQLTAAG